MTDIDSAVERRTESLAAQARLRMAVATTTRTDPPNPHDTTEVRPDDLASLLAALSHEKARADEAERERDEAIHQRDGYRWHLTECEQIAGKALSYPWFKDDQKNFPGATEAEGVCIGEHVGDSIVEELARKLTRLRAIEAAGRETLDRYISNAEEMARIERGTAKVIVNGCVKLLRKLRAEILALKPAGGA